MTCEREKRKMLANKDKKNLKQDIPRQHALANKASLTLPREIETTTTTKVEVVVEVINKKTKVDRVFIPDNKV